MKVIQRDPGHSILRLDKGDELITVLKDFAEREEIRAASFTAIGACSDVVISFYDLPKKAYMDYTYTEPLEIVSLTGNIGILTGEPTIHAHGVFGKADYSTIAGHIKSMKVSATCEIFMTHFPGVITRAHDEETGLNLIQDSESLF